MSSERLAGEHDGVGARAKFLALGDDVDAVEARHVEIDDDAVVGVLLERGDGREPVGADGDAWPMRGSSSFISSCSEGSSSANSRVNA